MKNGVILCPKRSGSTFLQEALNSHPQIICHDEIFMNNKKIRKRRGQVLFRIKKSEEGMNVNQYLDWVNGQDPDKSTLFRLIYLHDSKHKVLDEIMKKKIPVIHLTRENLFQKELSRVTKGRELGEKVDVDTKTALDQMRNERKNNNEYRKKLKNYKSKIEVNYENMIGETEGDQESVKKYGAFNIVSNQITYLDEKVGRKICKLLEVDYYPMWTYVSKRNPWNMEDIVRNYDEVKKKLKSTEFSHLVE